MRPAALLRHEPGQMRWLSHLAQNTDRTHSRIPTRCTRANVTDARCVSQRAGCSIPRESQVGDGGRKLSPCVSRRRILDRGGWQISIGDRLLRGAGKKISWIYDRIHSTARLSPTDRTGSPCPPLGNPNAKHAMRSCLCRKIACCCHGMRRVIQLAKTRRSRRQPLARVKFRIACVAPAQDRAQYAESKGHRSASLSA